MEANNLRLKQKRIFFGHLGSVQRSNVSQNCASNQKVNRVVPRSRHQRIVKIAQRLKRFNVYIYMITQPGCRTPRNKRCKRSDIQKYYSQYCKWRYFLDICQMFHSFRNRRCENFRVTCTPCGLTGGLDIRATVNIRRYCPSVLSWRGP